AIMSSTAAAIFIANDLVNYPYAISLAAGFAIGAWVGAGIGAKKGNRFIKILMISIIMISVIKLVVDFVLAT
ncbi:hypothetical protein KKC44_05705, partial [Patescibacteria group bacterium]|nr:hypothetical protein [Patescibacteria group bacterium]